MTAREAAHRYSAIDERAAVGFATALLHHWWGHDLLSRLLPVFGNHLGDANKAQEFYELAQQAERHSPFSANTSSGCGDDYCAMREASVGGPIVVCGQTRSSNAGPR